MFQDDIFDDWLDSESKSVLNKFKTNEPLTIEDKMILTLKAQTNHFHHLDQDIRQDISNLDNKTMKAISELDNKTMKAITRLEENNNKRFEQLNIEIKNINIEIKNINIEIKNIYKAINNQTWKMLGAIGLIVVLSKLAESLPFIKFG